MKHLPKLGALVLILLAVALAFFGEPTLEAQLEAAKPELDEMIASRDYHVDPGEVLESMYNNRAKIVLIDVRDDRDYNLFHLLDARHLAIDELHGDWPVDHAAVIVMSNDEARAEKAWRVLRVLEVENSYILAGGVNLWCDIYIRGNADAQPATGQEATDAFRHADLFTLPVGDRHPAAEPNINTAPIRDFTPKLELSTPLAVEGGGCG